MSAEHLSAEQLARKVAADEARPARPIEPPAKSPHEAFMEAAAVEALAAALAAAGGRRWSFISIDQREQWRAEARRLITENMAAPSQEEG